MGDEQTDIERGDPVEVRLIFRNLTGDQREHVYEASRHLAEAGVGFDSGHSVGSSLEGTTLDWELDWSLFGPVEVRFVRKRTEPWRETLRPPLASTAAGELGANAE